MNSKLKVVTPPAAQFGQMRFEHLTAKERIDSTHTEELVIALCGPLGSPMNDVARKLEQVLRDVFDYETVVLRVDQYVQDFATRQGQALPQRPAERRSALIEYGSLMRTEFGVSVLAELAVNHIRYGRGRTAIANGSHEAGARRICHIIDSIKSPQELDLLRTVYRELLYVIGVHSPLSDREVMLKAEGLEISDIAALMDRESGEEVAVGQSVEQTFSRCDFFLRMDSYTESQLRTRVERFLHLVLGSRVITPTRSETAMYAAASAAGNSACLSRQVGAAVTDESGEVLAIGWNDVPRPFGDLYVTDLASDPSGERDKRCWNFGEKCHNDEEKSLFAAHVVDALAPLIKDGEHRRATEVVAKNKKLRGLVEFSRAIHAEMHALLTALRQTGERVLGGSIFVTTYPCHACARHLVAAGIRQIHFIEPYKKSLAIKLHADALTESDQPGRVKLIPYDGVAPARYLSLFKMAPDSRKRAGKLLQIPSGAATPKLEKSLAALPVLESLVIESLRERSLIADDESKLPHTNGVAEHEAT